VGVLAVEENDHRRACGELTVVVATEGALSHCCWLKPIPGPGSATRFKVCEPYESGKLAAL